VARAAVRKSQSSCCAVYDWEAAQEAQMDAASSWPPAPYDSSRQHRLSDAADNKPTALTAAQRRAADPKAQTMVQMVFSRARRLC
jgi:hypothetical protein